MVKCQKNFFYHRIWHLGSSSGNNTLVKGDYFPIFVGTVTPHGQQPHVRGGRSHLVLTVHSAVCLGQAGLLLPELPIPQLHLEEDSPTAPCTSPPKEAIFQDAFTGIQREKNSPVQEAPGSSEVGDLPSPSGLPGGPITSHLSHWVINRNTSLPVDHPDCHTHACECCVLSPSVLSASLQPPRL